MLFHDVLEPVGSVRFAACAARLVNAVAMEDEQSPAATLIFRCGMRYQRAAPHRAGDRKAWLTEEGNQADLVDL
jgi:hypothetical protein